MTRIKLRRDTYANFTSSNPVLGSGEPAYETDTKKLKIGDGSTAYTQLDYFSSGGGGVDISATLPLKIDENSVISLEVDGQTIQIVDGKLHANLDELGNEVNTIAGEVTAVQADVLTKQDKLTAGDNITISTDNIISAIVSGGDLEVKVSSNANFNSAELLETGLYYVPSAFIPQNSPTGYTAAGMLLTMKWFNSYSNQRIQQTWIGTDDVIGNQIWTRYSNGYGDMTSWVRVDSNKVASASVLGSVKVGDGLSITTDGVLSVSGGGSTPDNMVTTDTGQTITGIKTFSNSIYLDAISSIPNIYLRYEDLLDSGIYNIQLLNLTDAGTREISFGDSRFTTILKGTYRDQNNNLFLKTKSLTQSEYDALTTKDSSILYVITD